MTRKLLTRVMNSTDFCIVLARCEGRDKNASSLGINKVKVVVLSFSCFSNAARVTRSPFITLKNKINYMSQNARGIKIKYITAKKKK